MEHFLPEHNPELTAELQVKAQRLSAILKAHHCGKSTAVTSPRIETRLGVTGVEVRAMVSHLRANGQPICSSGSGYWWPANAEEIEQTIAHLDHRRTALDYLIKDLQAAARRMEAKT